MDASSAHHNHNSNTQCNCHHATTTAVQNLDELDFERGIWQAAIYNDINKIKEFINKSHTNDRDNSGYTALHYAARNGHLEACQILLSAGCDVNSQTNGGSTALHRAALMGKEVVVKLLILNKAQTSIKDTDGKTALHRAVENKHVSIVKILVDYDKDLVWMRDGKDRLPIDLISSHENCTELKALLM